MRKSTIILGVIVSLTAIYAGFTFSSYILQDEKKSYDMKKESLVGNESLDTSKITGCCGFIVGKGHKGSSSTLLNHKYKPSPHMKEKVIGDIYMAVGNKSFEK